jgi:hypothetical protein
MLPVSLDCPFLVALSLFSNVYCMAMGKLFQSQKLDIAGKAISMSHLQTIGLIVHHFDLCDITILLQKPFYKHTFYLQSYLFHMEKIFEISSNQKALVCHIGGQIYIHSVLHTDNRPLIYSFPRLN